MTEQPTDRRSEDLRQAADVARDVQRYVATLHAVAAGAADSQAVALLLLDVAQICLTGAHLSARTDVVLDHSVEPGGAELFDADALREGLARELDDLDAYTEVFDPYEPDEPEQRLLSDDLTDAAVDLLVGLAHYDAGRSREALWWWQYTCLNSWGTSLSAALRALQSVTAHARLDAGREHLPEVV
ncbi:MAG: hypothetical protein JWO60_1634 [Frankiales bacterium]|nr:hypothetical protein [Frankiales bacterium]